MTRRVQVNRVYEIPCFRKSHNTLHLGGGGGVVCIKTMDIQFTEA